jgi:small Trp-rich protein
MEDDEIQCLNGFRESGLTDGANGEEAIMYFVGLGVLLLVLKLGEVGPVDRWPWWLVLGPFGLALAWWAFADASGYTKRRAMKAMDAKRDARRREQMEALGTGPKPRR